MIVLIDNYDSFTFNLVHYLGELGADVVVHRNDKIGVDEVIGARSGRDRALARPLHAERGRHLPRPDRQGRADDPDPRRLPRPSGDRPGVRRQGGARAGAGARQALRDHATRAQGVFRGINGPFKATRYHSLVVERATLAGRPRGHRRDRRRPGHGRCAHKTLPVHGVQFHPESIASEHGHLILKNFLDIAAAWNAATGAGAPRQRIEGSVMDEFKALIGKVATGATLTREEAAARLRPHDVGRGDALADGRPPDGAARARRDRRRDHRRGHHHARQDAEGRSAARRDRRGRHRRRRVRLLQHLDLRGLHRGRRRRSGRQARQPRALLALGRGRRARRARREDRSARRTRSRAASTRPASASCSRRRIIRR